MEYGGGVGGEVGMVVLLRILEMLLEGVEGLKVLSGFARDRTMDVGEVRYSMFCRNLVEGYALVGRLPANSCSISKPI